MDVLRNIQIVNENCCYDLCETSTNSADSPPLPVHRHINTQIIADESIQVILDNAISPLDSGNTSLPVFKLANEIQGQVSPGNSYTIILAQR